MSHVICIVDLQAAYKLCNYGLVPSKRHVAISLVLALKRWFDITP